MSSAAFPIVVEPAALESRLGDADLLVVDLCRPETYASGHIPGAVHLEYAAIVAARPPVGGLLPSAEELSRVLSSIGLTPQRQVVAYDEEGGGRAGRLLWTLEVLGHARASILNGGLHAWVNEGRRLDSDPVHPTASDYTAVIGSSSLADRDYIRERLGSDDLVLLDTRTPEEFRGIRRASARGGHIPGAVNMDWTLAMDRARNLRLKPEGELRRQFEELGVTPDREVVVYCQTHHRSSHTYAVLRHLGYSRVRGYHGAWSDWGNAPDTPIET